MPFLQFLFNFCECEVDNVMVVDFFRFKALATLKPDLVQEIDFFRSQVRSVRAKIINLFPAARRVNFHR